MDHSIKLTEKRTTKEFKHYKTSFNHVKEPNFIYVGMNLLNVPYLIATLGGGMSVKNAEEAISILKNLLKGNVVPKVIFIGGDTNLNALKLLHAYTSSHVSYTLTLFILDGSKLSGNDLIAFRKSGFLDEIMFLDNVVGKNKLISDIGFLKEIKRKSLQRFKLEKSEEAVYEAFGPRVVSKRIFDIVVSFSLIVFLGPVFLLIAVLIKMESVGPVFYIAPRAGRGYQIFNFYKFRTMAVGADKMITGLSHLNQYNANAESVPSFFKIANDPRVTRIGAFLRNTSLDELPQLFNVLWGDMSMVGNRPLPPYEAATLTTDEWAVRFLAPAGITGLWQIKKRGKAEMSVEERMKLDIDYANSNSFILDIWIIINTPFALIQKTDA